MQQVERWVLAPLRNRQFFSLDALNAAIAEQLAALNNRPLSADSTQTRASVFATYEKPKLKALPREPFVVGRWQRFKLGCDYHISIDGVAYSAPFGLIGKPVDVQERTFIVSDKRSLRARPGWSAFSTRACPRESGG